MLEFSSIASTSSEINTPQFCKSLIPISRAVRGLNQIKHVENLPQCLALSARKYVGTIFSIEVLWLKLLRERVY